MSFWSEILASLAKKFDSVINRPFENMFIWSLFSFGSFLILGSTVYNYSAKAELKNEGFSLILNFVSGPEIIPTILGSILIAFSIAIFWKTKIPNKSNNKSDFDKLVREGIDSFSDYEIQKSFKADFKYLAPVEAIKLILKLEDSLLRFFDYKKARSHIIIYNDNFVVEKPKMLNFISITSTVSYFLSGFSAMGILQIIIWSINSSNSFDIFQLFMLLGSLILLSGASLYTFGGTTAARRLIDSTVRAQYVCSNGK